MLKIFIVIACIGAGDLFGYSLCRAASMGDRKAADMHEGNVQ